MSKFYVICEHINCNTFTHCNDEGAASVFATEAEAIEAASEFPPALVVRAVATVTKTEPRIKVTKVK